MLAEVAPGCPSTSTVVSSATFHWITDHPTLFANLAAVLPPGGPAARSGRSAAGRATSPRSSTLADVSYSGRNAWHFATPKEEWPTCAPPAPSGRWPLPGPTIDHVRLDLVARLDGLSG